MAFRMVPTATFAALFVVISGCGGSSDIASYSLAAPSLAAAGDEASALRAPAGQAAAASAPAQRMSLNGVPNLYRVSDGLYRGAVPSAEGMRQLRDMGVKTVVDLRWEGNDRGAIAGTGLQYEHMSFWTYTVKEADVVRFLHLAGDARTAPVYVHCRRGADRTGFICAVYRVVIEGWSRDQAVHEMVDGGFGFDMTYQNLISYIRTMNVENLRRKAGLPTPVQVAVN